MQLYLQSRLTWSSSRLVRHLMQVYAVYVALYVGLSRVSDYHHHWSDVLAGAVLGCLVACLTVRHSCKVRAICYKVQEDSETFQK